MAWDTFTAALGHVYGFIKAGTQHELNLTGIGESTLHPEFVRFLRFAREVVGPAIRITIPTNGLNVTEDLVREIKQFNPRFWVSMHAPQGVSRGVQALRDAGLLEGVTADPAVNPNDWAGQIQLPEGIRPMGRGVVPCMWLRDGAAFACADGRVLTCCLDASGSGVVGRVTDAVGSFRVKPYDLCAKCYQAPVEGWNGP